MIIYSLHLSKAQQFGTTVARQFLLNVLLKKNSQQLLFAFFWCGFWLFGCVVDCWWLFYLFVGFWGGREQWIILKTYSEFILIFLQMGFSVGKGCFSGALTFGAPLKDIRDLKIIDALRFQKLNSSSEYPGLQPIRLSWSSLIFKNAWCVFTLKNKIQIQIQINTNTNTNKGRNRLQNDSERQAYDGVEQQSHKQRQPKKKWPSFLNAIPSVLPLGESASAFVSQYDISFLHIWSSTQLLWYHKTNQSEKTAGYIWTHSYEDVPLSRKRLFLHVSRGGF